MSDPARIICGALKALAAEDETHRRIVLAGVFHEVVQILGGTCPTCPLQRVADMKPGTEVKAEIWHGHGGDDMAVVRRIRDHDATDTADGKTVQSAAAKLEAACRVI